MPTYYCSIAVTYTRISTFVWAASIATITTIAIDRLLAFYLRLRYREIVKLRRVVSALVANWSLARLWSGSWFWNATLNIMLVAIALFGFCLITLFCYLNIHRSHRRPLVHIYQWANAGELGELNVPQYKN